MRSESDAAYVIGLCDAILNHRGKRGHRFDFLRGDAGHRLPVGAYYQELQLVIEYRERQPSEIVVPIVKRLRVDGLPRDSLRLRYEQRRRDVLQQHGIKLVEFEYKNFDCDFHMRLTRIPADIDIVRGILDRAEALVLDTTRLK
jgi:hypothetical protein